MVKRKIVEIDGEKSTGCGLCIPACPEGAIQLVDGKARLISDIYCDGLGACLGECPEDAITIIEQEAEAFDEEAMKLHLLEMEEKQIPPAPEFSGCPGSRVMEWKSEREAPWSGKEVPPVQSELRQWPVQLMLVNPEAQYFENADLAIVADCVPFAYASFHQDFLKDTSIVVGCPKLDDLGFYQQKLAQIFSMNNIKSVTTVIMEVPCCAGLSHAVQQAIAESGKDIPYEKVVIGIKGNRHS
ncbi:MAG: 4Fe-4S dicluster domain-containing protein [Gemmatimonadota bacterium]|nr:MAG: 4Fe-4S dicluster domain-containing protein [Gemmatimonadota bacterium]